MQFPNRENVLDLEDILGINHEVFVLHMREVVKTDPVKYEKMRASCTKSLTDSMVQSSINAITFLLTEGTDFKIVDGRAERGDECFFGQDDEGKNIKCNFPSLETADIAMKIAEKNLDCIKEQLNMLFPTLEQVLEIEEKERLEEERILAVRTAKKLNTI